MGEKQLLDKLEEICSKEENIRKILQAKTKDDIKPLFEEKGIELTDERFEVLKKVYMGIIEKLKDMSEEELEQISGGAWENAKTGTGYGLSIGAPVGAVVGGAAGLISELVNTIANKDRSSFLKRVGRVASKTIVSAFAGASVGTMLGGATGAGVDLINDAYKSEFRCEKNI